MREFTVEELGLLAQGLADLNKSVLLKSTKAAADTTEKLLKSDLELAHQRIEALEGLLDEEMFSYEVEYVSYEGRNQVGQPPLKEVKTYIITAKSPVEALQEFERSIPGKLVSLTVLGPTLIACDFGCA